MAMISFIDEREPLATVEEAAAYLRIKPDTLRARFRKKQMPGGVQVGCGARRDFWRVKMSVIEAWANERTVKTA